MWMIAVWDVMKVKVLLLRSLTKLIRHSCSAAMSPSASSDSSCVGSVLVVRTLCFSRRSWHSLVSSSTSSSSSSSSSSSLWSWSSSSPSSSSSVMGERRTVLPPVVVGVSAWHCPFSSLRRGIRGTAAAPSLPPSSCCCRWRKSLCRFSRLNSLKVAAAWHSRLRATPRAFSERLNSTAWQRSTTAMFFTWCRYTQARILGRKGSAAQQVMRCSEYRDVMKVKVLLLRSLTKLIRHSCSAAMSPSASSDSSCVGSVLVVRTLCFSRHSRHSLVSSSTSSSSSSSSSSSLWSWSSSSPSSSSSVMGRGGRSLRRGIRGTAAAPSLPPSSCCCRWRKSLCRFSRLNSLKVAAAWHSRLRATPRAFSERLNSTAWQRSTTAMFFTWCRYTQARILGRKGSAAQQVMRCSEYRAHAEALRPHRQPHLQALLALLRVQILATASWVQPSPLAAMVTTLPSSTFCRLVWKRPPSQSRGGRSGSRSGQERSRELRME
ncbi:LOW QUALITY PROTEIN: hypothetical protein CRUP_013868, partial [Coryphaenoides rupestris]